VGTHGTPASSASPLVVVSARTSVLAMRVAHAHHSATYSTQRCRLSLSRSISRGLAGSASSCALRLRALRLCSGFSTTTSRYPPNYVARSELPQPLDYVARAALEWKLTQSLLDLPPHRVVVIEGPRLSGKTLLVEKVMAKMRSHYIVVDCHGSKPQVEASIRKVASASNEQNCAVSSRPQIDLRKTSCVDFSALLRREDQHPHWRWS
jgi:hypothetical protein